MEKLLPLLSSSFKPLLAGDFSFFHSQYFLLRQIPGSLYCTCRETGGSSYN